jgi:hypothetical protein
MPTIRSCRWSHKPHAEVNTMNEAIGLRLYEKLCTIVFLLLFVSTIPLCAADVRGSTPWTNLVRPATAATDEWSVGIYQGLTPLSLSPALGVNNPVLTAADVTDAPASFVADPFLIPINGTWYLFFEVLNTQTNQGDIGYAISTDGINWAYQSIILDEPHHLSYPYVFEWQGDYYMIPESAATGSVRLYRATSFPTGWVQVATLFSNSASIDPSILYHDGTWWMYASTSSNDTLRLFYADNLTGPWMEHPSSPVVAGDSNIARPGGRVIDYDGRFFRITQDDYPTYGNQVRAFEIVTLTRTDYAEVEVPESPLVTASGFGWNASGMHHLDAWQKGASTWIAAVDGVGDPSVNRIDPGISKTSWSLRYADSEELVGENGAAVNAFDSDPMTIWHTEWLNNNPPPPHEIQIDLGGVYVIDGFGYIPRQDGSPNGRIGDYEFYVSIDGINWGTPVASGSFTNDASAKEAHFAPVEGEFVRLRALTEASGNPWTSVAELNVMGTLGGEPINQAPDGTIDAPADDVMIDAGQGVEFLGGGSDPDGDEITYLWTFGVGSGVPDSTEQDPGVVVFSTPGTFAVILTVTDVQGLPDPTPATRTLTVLEPNVSSPLPQSNWVLWYTDSEELVGENGAAVNAFDGDPMTIWHTEWLNNNPPPPHEIQIDLGGVYVIDGFGYIPRQDGSPNGRIGDYEFYVSIDGINWGTPVASGSFANDASAKEAHFAPVVEGEFVRLRALTEANGWAWTSMAELNVFGLAP